MRISDWSSDVCSSDLLPLGAVAMVISRRALTRLHTPRIKRPVDYPGAVLMTIALAPLLIGITRVGQGAPWLDELNMELLGASIAAKIGRASCRERVCQTV